MRADVSGLPSTATHQKPRNIRHKLKPDTISDVVSTKFVGMSKNVEIHEHFILRIQTYKSWASFISKKSCSEILIDGFKSDVSNDFTLMIRWLAKTSEERRVVLESNCNRTGSIGLNVALDMLFQMGIQHKRSKGPTVDAFRELIAVLCGGIRGQIPLLDSLANFTETSQFCDEKSSNAIVEVVKTFFNSCCDTAQMAHCDEAVISPSEEMQEAEFTSAMQLNDSKVSKDCCIRCLPTNIDLDSCSTVEGTSQSNAGVQEISVDTAQNSFSGCSPTKSSTYVKQKREIYPIKSRRVGRMKTSLAPSEACFICEKNGDLISCRKRYASGYFCSTKFHMKCIEEYNAAEYNVDCLRKILDETICPLHFCSTCYLERWKTTSVRGQLVECDSCFRSFHLECSPAGFEIYQDALSVRTKEGTYVEIKQEFTRCHSHCNTKRILMVENKRSHLPFCCECEVAGEEALMRCCLCVRSFHESCLTLNYRDLDMTSKMNHNPLCESCILGETLRVGQAVIAKFRASFYAATITKLEDYPKRCLKMDKYGKYFNQPGYISVKWAGCDNLFQLLPVRCVVPMFTGSYELIGRKVKEESCRIAWEEMEQDLVLPRPTFDYIPEKYTKIKTSVYHSSCPKPKLDSCEESDSMCECPATESNRCGLNSKCTNRAILQECPEACEAIGDGCNNRGVSRKEVNPAMEIREAPGKGLGAFAVRNIPKGSFIAEYAGEIISNKEMNRRIAEITAHRNVEEKHYMMALDGQRIIDCKEKGNDARFLNHSCSPNCKVESVYVVVNRTKRSNGVYVKYDKRITIYTMEDVPAGAELCFNYQMRQYNIGCPLPDCKCGAPNCTGTLGAINGPALERMDPADNITEITRQRPKKRSSSGVVTQQPHKKKKPVVEKRKTIQSTLRRSSSNSGSPGRDKKSIPKGRPTVVFKRAFDFSSSQVHVRDTPSQICRIGSRRSKTIHGTSRVLRGRENSEVPPENTIAEKLLSRAFLKGTALEKISNNTLSQNLNEGSITNLRRTRRSAKLILSNGSL